MTASDTDEPLPGVNIVVQGTTIGTTTEADGTFNIDVPSLESTLQFSFVGYQSRQIPLNGRTQLEITLEPTAVAAEEVVVTAFGSQQRTEVTGSISSLQAEDINDISGASLDQALQGKVSGLQMTQGGASPAAKSRILIRGVGSIEAGTEPLFVIDGMPVAGPHTGGTVNPMSLVNPNDIESIEVLKDAAATALYGSRGSSGVVLITTKDGGTGGQFNVNYSTGRTSPTDTYDLVGTQQWFEIIDQAKANNPNGLSPFDPLSGDYTFAPSSVTMPDTLSRSQAMQNNTDWFDKILQTGQYHDVNVSFGGGNDQGTSYYVSTNYRTEESYLKDNGMDRFITRANADINPMENLTAGVRTNLAYLKKDNAPIGGGAPGGNKQISKGNWASAVGGALPWLPVRNAQGDFFNPLSGNNLVATLHEEGRKDWYVDWNRELRVLGKLYADYRIPSFEELTVHVEGSADYTQTKRIESTTDDLRDPDFGTPYGLTESGLGWSYNYNAYGTYQDNFGPHEVKVTAGAEANNEHFERTFIEVDNRTATDEYLGANLSNVTGNVSRLFDDRAEEQIFVGYFGRLNYNYEGRYLAQFSFRRDGSTRFGRGRQLGNFPAGAVGWVISEESFMDDIEPVNYLKLRASYGQTGNASIPGNVTNESWTGWKRYGTTSNGRFLSGGIAASNVGWETTKSTDISLEYGVLQDRITGSFAWYQQDVEGLLLNAPTAASGGDASSVWGNVGDLVNQGWEFEIESRNIVQEDFNWTTSLNLTFNSNEVKDLTAFISENNSGLNTNRTLTRIGTALGVYHLAKSAGVDPETGYEMIYEVDNDPFLVNEDGDYVDRQGTVVEEDNRVKNPNYLDTTGDLLPATSSNVAQNQALLDGKTGNPTYFGGLTNSLSYRGVNLSFTFNFQGGNYIYDGALQGLTNAAGPGNISEEYVGNYWTPQNTDAKYPSPSWNNQYTVNNQDVDSDGELESGVQTFSTSTTNYLYKGDYIRLRRVRLGYDIPQSLIGNLNMRSLNVYVAGSNLWTYAPDYPGLSPGVTSFDGNSRNRNLEPGIVGSQFTPPTRRFTVGINMGF